MKGLELLQQLENEENVWKKKRKESIWDDKVDGFEIWEENMMGRIVRMEDE